LNHVVEMGTHATVRYHFILSRDWIRAKEEKDNFTTRRRREREREKEMREPAALQSNY
jgi:hypothetical protein